MLGNTDQNDKKIRNKRDRWHSFTTILFFGLQTRIVEAAKKMADKDKDPTAGEAAMRKEFEQLLTVLTGGQGMDADDLKCVHTKLPIPPA